jgi:hypothetical protein
MIITVLYSLCQSIGRNIKILNCMMVVSSIEFRNIFAYNQERVLPDSIISDNFIYLIQEPFRVPWREREALRNFREENKIA